MNRKERKYDRCSGLDYVWNGDYFVPDTAIPEDVKKIGGFGLWRRRYLMLYDKDAYVRLYQEKKMEKHLIAINKRASYLYEKEFERLLHELCPGASELTGNSKAIYTEMGYRRLVRDEVRSIVEKTIICIPYSDEWEAW